MTPPTAEPRWAPGTSFVPYGDDWLVHTPDEELLHLEADPESAGALHALVTGSPARPQSEQAAELVTALTGYGAVDNAPVPRRPRVGVTGGGPARAALERLLSAYGLPLRAAAAERGELAEHAGLDVLVACGEVLPDNDWQRLDERCAAAGLPWHRIYREGRRWYTGPLTDPERGSPGYRDLRLRRLAASGHPEQLLAYWRWAESGGRPVPGRDGPAVEVAAALVVADLMAWARGADDIPALSAQTGIDPHTLAAVRHPVLPVPTGLMTEIP